MTYFPINSCNFFLIKIEKKQAEIEDMAKIVHNGQNKAQIDLETHYDYLQRSMDLFNPMTLEIVRLMKLLMNFGKYTIKVASDHPPEVTLEKNKDFFGILRTLVSFLEIDRKYPEVRRILLEKREEKKKE